jgi:hypothetical protein
MGMVYEALPLLLAACWFVQGEAQAHDIITTSITWGRDISRIVYNHCASCHHPGGKAFSLMTFSDASPWAVAIKEKFFAAVCRPGNNQDPAIFAAIRPPKRWSGSWAGPMVASLRAGQGL